MHIDIISITHMNKSMQKCRETMIIQHVRLFANVHDTFSPLWTINLMVYNLPQRMVPESFY